MAYCPGHRLPLTAHFPLPPDTTLAAGLRSIISAILGNAILMISPFAHCILTLGVVRACVVFMLRTMPRTRCPSVVMISTLSLPYRGCRAARALVTSTIISIPSSVSKSFAFGGLILRLSTPDVYCRGAQREGSTSLFQPTCSHARHVNSPSVKHYACRG